MGANKTNQVEDKPEFEQYRRHVAAMNQELMLSVVRQHELTEAAERLNEKLQFEIAERKRAEDEIRKLNDELELRVA